MDVYLTVVGQLLFAVALLAWALWRNHRDQMEPRNSSGSEPTPAPSAEE